MTRTPTAEEILDAWTAQLTAAGWTYQSTEAIPGHLPTLRHLLDPSGQVQAHAHAYDPTDIDVELHEAPPSPDGHPAWSVTAGWLSAEAVIAAANAANDAAVGQAAGELLITAGWTLQRYEALSPTLAEYQWASPDDTRWACFTTPDTDPDAAVGSGGWILARPGDHGGQQRIVASASTPAATVAALALSE